MKTKLYIATAAFILSLLLPVSASFARQWKPSPTKAAQDYLNLNHQMKNGDQVFLMWIAPQYIAATPETKTARDLLKRYTLIGLVRYNVDKVGRFNFQKIENVAVEIENAQVIQAVDQDKLPPLIPSFITYLSKALSGGMGRVGQSIQYFTFDAGGIDGCDDKTFFVRYLDERYEFKGPIPGC